jgi:hypothetical protein
MTMITDGTGSNYRAGVTASNRVLTDTKSQTVFEFQTELGNAFNLNTEDITIPTGVTGDQGLLYVKNNGTSDLVLLGWFIGIRNADRTSATDDTNLFKLIPNPTGGTLLSDAEPAVEVNRNMGSSTVFDIDTYKATGGGKTVTGNSQAVLYQYHTTGRTFGSVTLAVPRGQSLAITVDTYGAGFDIYTGFTGYLG